MSDYYLDRHYKLWEDNNKRITRVVFVSLVISIALIIKVLSPFVSESGKKKPHFEKIETIERQKTDLENKIKFIDQIKSKMINIGQTME